MRGALLAGLICFAAGAARAERPAMVRLPDEKLKQLPPLLSHGDLALVESNPDGSMRQVTLLLFVAAKPETVHDVVAKPGEYKKFIRNVSRSSWEQKDGKWISSWQIDLPVSEFDATDAYEFDPGPTGGVIVTAIDPHDNTNYRWDFVGVPGGTVLVQYGYTDVKHSNKFVRSFIQRQAMMEHGLALAAQLILATAMRQEAEKRTPKGALPPVDKTAKSPGFNWMLDRGQVVVMRSRDDGRLGDVSVLDRVFTSPEKIIDALTHPGEFAKFIPGVDESYERARAGVQIEYHSIMSVPLVSWNTVYSMRTGGNTVEGVGTSGDLRGAHYQWDLVKRAVNETLAIYRVNEPIAQSSIILRKLIEYEPSLEHGLGVAFGLIYMRAFRGRAEGWK